MKRSSKRDELVETARGLFYEKGILATGIDTILAESGVAKMTLYKHFRSKDDLILAVLRDNEARWREWFRTEVERRASTPKEQLIAVFEVLSAWVNGKDFRGCLLFNAVAECRGLDLRIQGVVLELRQGRRLFLKSLAAAAGVQDPTLLVSQLSLLIEGTIAMTLVHRDPQHAATAHATAALLIRDATARPKHRPTKSA